MQVTIHRGTQEVGGSCIEISSFNSCILVDFGLPLSFEFGDDVDAFLPEPLYSKIVKRDKKIDALLLSHAHLDHFGLIGKLPKDIPIYVGNATAELIRFIDKFTPNKIGHINAVTFQAHKPFSIGDFNITPYLIDHSAFDSHAFLIRSNKKSIFYSGDFRGHGLKSEQFDDLIANPPKVDMLLMEGTVIGERHEERFPSEIEIEKQMVDFCQETKGAVFVTVPSQNIDRIISFSRAAKQSGRKFIIDLYSAELFARIKDYSVDIPQPFWPHVLLWYPWIQRENLYKHGLGWVMKKHKKWKKSLEELAVEIPNSIMMLRPPFRKQIERNAELSNSIWVYSMWKGYLERSEPLKRLQQWTKKNGIPFVFLHTSGHAKITDLKRLAKALSPKVLIPIHSFHVERFAEYFENVQLVNDGEIVEV
jgi:ribonuclease J